ncbi:hypothetical protein JB92DRAFT_2838864 [Gautieria morchelliformis]|nr:hypothetical protein JB92DRAFT_2838864 [Gautieria morchelliformis]
MIIAFWTLILRKLVCAHPHPGRDIATSRPGVLARPCLRLTFQRVTFLSIALVHASVPKSPGRTGEAEAIVSNSMSSRSPVTFAAAPPPTSRPPNAASYQASTSLASSSSATLAAPQTSALPVSPVTFADAPIVPARPSEPIQHHPPQSPLQHLFYPALSPAPDTPTRPVSPGPSVPSPASARISFDQDEEDLPLYANSYGAALDQQLHDEDSDGILTRVHLSCHALKSTLNKNVSGRGYSGNLSNVNVELARKATSLAKRWLVYSFSTVSYPVVRKRVGTRYVAARSKPQLQYIEFCFLAAGGKTVTVTVEDKCAGCAQFDLDMSPAAFDQLADPSVGRLHGVTWHLL